MEDSKLLERVGAPRPGSPASNEWGGPSEPVPCLVCKCGSQWNELTLNCCVVILGKVSHAIHRASGASGRSEGGLSDFQ
jgi:hypothetical protein